MKRQILVTLLCLGCVVALVGPGQAMAQDRTDFSQLESTLKQDDKLTVTTDGGTQVKGRLLEISADRIVVETKSGPKTITASQIMKVERKKNGVLLGALIGAVAAVPLTVGAAQYGQNEGSGTGPAVLVPILIGAGIGTAIDFALPSHKTLYDRNAKPRISLAPVVGKRQLGAQIAIKF